MRVDRPAQFIPGRRLLCGYGLVARPGPASACLKGIRDTTDLVGRRLTAGCSLCGILSGVVVDDSLSFGLGLTELRNCRADGTFEARQCVV